MQAPIEICDDVEEELEPNKCFAPARNIARRTCENVPKIVQREVCTSKPTPCPGSCREEQEEECDQVDCSRDQHCWTELEEVCQEVELDSCTDPTGEYSRTRRDLNPARQPFSEEPFFSEELEFLDPDSWVGSNEVEDGEQFGQKLEFMDSSGCRLVPVPSCREVERRVCSPTPVCSLVPNPKYVVFYPK